MDLHCFTPKALGQIDVPAVGVGLHEVQPQLSTAEGNPHHADQQYHRSAGDGPQATPPRRAGIEHEQCEGGSNQCRFA